VTYHEKIQRLEAELSDERTLADRAKQIEAELERRVTTSERQARALRPATPRLDSRPLSELSTDERQATALRGRRAVEG
jgi:hypothetical protein